MSLCLTVLPCKDTVLCHNLGGLGFCFTITNIFLHRFLKTNTDVSSEVDREKLVKK